MIEDKTRVWGKGAKESLNETAESSGKTSTKTLEAGCSQTTAQLSNWRKLKLIIHSQRFIKNPKSTCSADLYFCLFSCRRTPFKCNEFCSAETCFALVESGKVTCSASKTEDLNRRTCGGGLLFMDLRSTLQRFLLGGGL